MTIPPSFSKLARTLPIVVAVSVFGNATADLLFPDPVYEARPFPTSVAVGDFNADGNDDLAVASVGGPRGLSVYLGQGDGSFEFVGVLGSGMRPISTAQGDFDGDGILDLVIADFTVDWVTVFIGNGDGTFGDGIPIDTGSSPRSVSVGDLNGDGIADLAVANHDSADVSILLGEGDGSFAPQIRHEIGGFPWAIGVGEFNRDGRLDLAVLGAVADRVAVLLGDGQGGFTIAGAFGTGENPGAMAIGDLDGDQRMDVVVANFGRTALGDVSVLYGKSDGTFEPETRLAVGNPGEPDDVNRTSSIRIGDVNRDGDADLVLSNYGSDDFSVILGDGDRVFRPEIRTTTRTGPRSVAIADFDNDGRQDVAVASNASVNNSEIQARLGNGDGTFQSRSRIDLGGLIDSVAVNDFDGDGHLDVLCAAGFLGGNGDGTFEPPLPFHGAGSTTIATGDFDGNGTRDVALADFYRDRIAVVLGNGNGSFAEPALYGVGVQPLWIVTGDFDDDSRLDLAVTNQASGDVSILFGNGDGTFLPESRIATGGIPKGATVADFDRDGNDDIAAANYGFRDIYILRGAADRTFSIDSFQAPILGPFSTAAADLDRDGREDLIVGALNGLVLVYPGNGDGTFGPWTYYLASGGARSIAVGDLNDDGWDDLALASVNEDGAAVLLNRGDGTLEPQPLYVAGDSPKLVAIGDLNEDGRNDLALAADGIVLLFNLTTPNRPPMADAGIDVVVACTSREGAPVVLDASASTDPDSTSANNEIADFEWIEFFGSPEEFLLGRGENSEIRLAEGDHDITLRVTDRDGESDTDGIVVTVTDLEDPDGDGVGACADNCATQINPDQADADDDSVGDPCDNCRDTGNTDQLDLVHLNGTGDACDDPDFDGAVDADDNCPDVANPSQLDADADEVGDACDVCPVTANAAQAESVACIDVTEDGGQCLETAIDLQSGLSGDILLFEIAGESPEFMEIDILATSCLGADEMRTWLNGIPLQSFVVDQVLSCYCSTPLATIALADAQLLRFLWNPGVQNVFRLEKANGNLGTGLAWARLRVGSASQTITECVFDASGGQCDERLCAALEFDAVAVEESLLDPFLSENLVSTTAFTDSRFADLIGLDSAADGRSRICLSVPDGRMDCAEFGKSGEEDLAINGVPCGPPTADAGEDSTVECSSPSGAPVRLNGAGSTDPNSTPGTNDDIVLFEWFTGFGTPAEILIGTGPTQEVALPIGTHVITLRVTDTFGETDIDEVIHSVVDTMAPSIQVSLVPHVLWPPNHQLVEVFAAVDASDACSAPRVSLMSVTSDEPDDGLGSGNTVDDIQHADVGTPDFQFSVRAERSGPFDGRIYTAVYSASDDSGNEASASAVAYVPRDRSAITKRPQLPLGEEEKRLTTKSRTPKARDQ